MKKKNVIIKIKNKLCVAFKRSLQAKRKTEKEDDEGKIQKKKNLGKFLKITSDYLNENDEKLTKNIKLIINRYFI